MITNSFKNLQYVYLATVDAMLSLPFGSKLMSPDIHMQLLMSFYGIEWGHTFYANSDNFAYLISLIPVQLLQH